MTPSELLAAAADRVRDLAADTTKPRPNGHGWGVIGEENSWDPSWSAVVSCAGYGGEVPVAVDVRVGDGRWIASLSPAIAAPLEAILRQAALAYELNGDCQQDENALTLARAVLGEDTHEAR